jgi:hypothetical protein
MKTLLFATILLFAGISYGGGSEVPWPLTSEQPVFLENLAGYWMANLPEETDTYYHFYFQKMAPRPGCPYIVGVEEIDLETQEIKTRGTSSYCLVHPRKLSFVMYTTDGQQTHVLNFVGVKKENTSAMILGTQYIGMSLYSDTVRLVPIQQTLLYKFNP